jgi:predicted ATPase/DNA-binding CsgD family transcriptional regulator/DNA-binding XRE family transcriptional regulator
VKAVPAAAPAFGRLLRSHRRAAGLTQEALAERAGLSRRGLQHLEAGDALPHPATLDALLAALVLTLEDRARLRVVASAPPGSPRPAGAADDPPGPRRPTRSGRGPTTLPAPLTSFVGREREVATVVDLLRRDDVRLLTVTGPGGVGKTRVAQRAAAALADGFADGAYLVSLAPLRDPALVLPTIGQAVGARQARLADYLGAKRVLLVLDNCEHLLAAGPGVADLLAAGPGLKVLATSREALALSGERELPLRPLPPPDPQRPTAARLAGNDAVRLFVERAAAADPAFGLSDENAPAVARICRRLDGLPLALELAAARTRLLPPAALAARLESRLRVLAAGPRDAPPRHRTLRDALAWSYDLLGPDERALFRRLAVFAGGWTLEAAAAVCAAGRGGGEGDAGEGGDVLDRLGSLAAKSLLHPAPGPADEPRFAMLETTREYAQERLEDTGEGPTLRRRHAAHFLALAERAQPEHYGPAQVAWLDRVEREHDNLRAALRWFVAAGDARRGTRLATALGRFWWVRGHTGEARAWYVTLVELARRDQSRGGDGPATLARALTGAAMFAYLEGDEAALGALAAEAVALCRRLGDRRTLAEALHLLGHRYLDPGTDYAAARAQFEESASHYRAVGADWGLGWSLHCLASTVWQVGDGEAARRAYEESLRLFRAVGDNNMTAHPIGGLGVLAFDRGERERGRALLEESVTIFRASGDRRYLALELDRSGDLACEAGDSGAARRAYCESLAVAAELGARNQIAYTLEGFAMLAAAQAQPERALRLAGAAAALRDTAGRPRRPAERPRLERALAAARAALGPAAPGAWQRGRRLTTEQAIAAALEAPAGTGPERLTGREQDVVALLARGWSNRQIAARLAIAEGTARIHVERILGKLGFRSRAQVAAWAVQQADLCLSTDATAIRPP